MYRLRVQGRADSFHEHGPIYVIREITLACELSCLRCGSRAGLNRQRDVTRAQGIDVQSSLAP